ncbi:MAG: hypothetical protein BRD43_07535, partial [Bacteroidetes bacterium QS_4_64_154]
MKTRKGHSGETVERVSPPSEADEVNEINLGSESSFSHASGTTISSRIGPASDWDSLRWSGTAPDAEDMISIDVLAADSTVLIDNLSGPSGERSLSAIDAQEHPRLHFRATLTDSTSRTAPQLNEWSASYMGVPELAVDPSRLGAVPDTLLQGERVSASIPVVNFGPVASTPVRARVTLQDASNTTTTLLTDTLSALAPNGGRDTTSLAFSTTEFSGNNLITVEANTDGPPERLPSNNTSVRNLFVEQDQTPPAVQVLANGREVPPTFEDESFQAPQLPFVSTQPTLEILVSDNNPNL